VFRYLTAIFLLFAFSAQTFQKAFIVLEYYTNTASFARNCENKALPKMHCNGRCQMMKKLKAEEKKEQQTPERKIENKTQTLSSKSFFAGAALVQIDPMAIMAPGFLCLNPVDRSYAFFHPPALV
jgi:hypothetical protein